MYVKKMRLKQMRAFALWHSAAGMGDKQDFVAVRAGARQADDWRPIFENYRADYPYLHLHTMPL